nr:MAG TPA_asm: hypothetical protein [Caudoviricetes sp.]
MSGEVKIVPEFCIDITPGRSDLYKQVGREISTMLSV